MANEPQIQTFEGTDGQYYNRIVAANGETLMLSEGFPDRSTAKDNIEATERVLTELLEDTTDAA